MSFKEIEGKQPSVHWKGRSNVFSLLLTPIMRASSKRNLQPAKNGSYWSTWWWQWTVCSFQINFISWKMQVIAHNLGNVNPEVQKHKLSLYVFKRESSEASSFAFAKLGILSLWHRFTNDNAWMHLKTNHFSTTKAHLLIYRCKLLVPYESLSKVRNSELHYGLFPEIWPSVTSIQRILNNILCNCSIFTLK